MIDGMDAHNQREHLKDCLSIMGAWRRSAEASAAEVTKQSDIVKALIVTLNSCVDNYHEARVQGSAFIKLMASPDMEKAINEASRLIGIVKDLEILSKSGILAAFKSGNTGGDNT